MEIKIAHDKIEISKNKNKLTCKEQDNVNKRRFNKKEREIQNIINNSAKEEKIKGNSVRVG